MKKDDDEMRQEMELQLHQQLAENQNASISSFVGFVAALVATFGGWGYVYIHTCFNNSILNGDESFDVCSYLTTTVFASIVLVFLATLALSFGTTYRKNQKIVNRIRNKYKMSDVFGTDYNDEGKNYFTFIPGFYNVCYFFITILQTGLIFVTDISICNCKCCSGIFCSRDCNVCWDVSYNVYDNVIIGSLVFMIIMRIVYIEKYIGDKWYLCYRLKKMSKCNNS